MRFARLLGPAFGLMALLWAAGAGAPPAAAQPADSLAAIAAPDTALTPADTVRFAPYRTNRSFGEHLLALPSYALHYAVKPLGWAVKYAETNYAYLFQGNLPAVGAFPLIELGGDAGTAGGLVAYHNNFLGDGHAARVRGLYGSGNYYEFGGSYRVPGLAGAGSSIRLEGAYTRDPVERFFIGGNDSREESDRARYGLRRADAALALALPPRALSGPAGRARLSTDLSVRYERFNVERDVDLDDDDDFDDDGFDDDEQLLPPGIEGLETANLLTAGAEVRLRQVGARRPLGPEVHLLLEATEDMGAAGYRYGRYLIDVRQFVPAPFLPRTRRFAVRGRLEKVEPLGGTIPFYNQSRLGGTQFLRGFTNNRFRGAGALLLGVEYRYPAWSFLDVVFFLDEGQVFDDYGEVALGRFHTSGGAGLYVLGEDGLSFRFEVAASSEGIRPILTVAPTF